MTGRGRPLRFLVLVVTGWVGVRAAMLWQVAEPPHAIRQILPAARAHSAPPADTGTPTPPAAQSERPEMMKAAYMESLPRPPSPASPFVEAAKTGSALTPVAQPVLATAGIEPSSLPAQLRLEPMLSPWSGSAWLVARPGTGIGAAPGGQLGGSQAGMRIAYLLDRKHRIAIFGRIVTPLAGRGREAALGLEWHPTRAPVRVVVEHRFPIDGGRAASGLGLVAGGDHGFAGFRLESYAQAGALRRERIEPYADGAIRLTRALGRSRFAVGAGAWGAAQRNAARLDVGPSATLAAPLGKRNIRLALDWRQRVAGSAHPASGVALTLGSDF